MNVYLRPTRKTKTYRGVEQLVARRAHNPKVVGSSPAPATKKGSQRKLLPFFCFVYFFILLGGLLSA